MQASPDSHNEPQQPHTASTPPVDADRSVAKDSALDLTQLTFTTGRHEPATEQTVDIDNTAEQEEPATTTPELSDRSQQLLEEVSRLYENWDALDKDIKAAHLEQVATAISSYVDETVEHIAVLVDNLESFSSSQLISMSPQEFSSFMDREQQIENTLREHLKEFNLATVLLTSGPILKGRKEFGTSTGFLDNNPKTAGALAVTASLLGMGAAVYGLIACHHTVAEASAHVLSHIATPGTWTYGALDLGAHATILLVDSLIAFSASAAGALGFGFLKTAAGRLRRQTPSGHTAFEVERESAEALQNAIEESVSHSNTALERLSSILPQFYSRNEHIRAAASHFILSAETERGTEALDADGAPIREALEQKAWEIGKYEFRDTLQMLRLQKTFGKLQDVDIRSAEMKEIIAEETATEQKSGGISSWCGRQLSLATKSIGKVFGASDQAGTQAALDMAEQISHDLNDLPSSALDTFTGLGSGLSHFLGVMIEGGKRPEQSLLETFKGLVHLLNFGADRKHGPGFRELVRLILEVPDMKNPNRRLRWFGKFIPNVVLLVFKKPALFVRMAKEREQRGVIDPESLKNEVQAGRGRWANAWHMTKETGKALGQATIGGLAKLCIEVPLKTAANLQRRSSLLRLLPSASNGLKNWYGFKMGRIQQELNDLLSVIPDGADLQSRSEEHIQRRVLKALVEYQFGNEDPERYKEVKALLRFWDKWDNLRYLEGRRRQLEHKDELLTTDSKLQMIRELSRDTNKTFVESARSFVTFIMADADEEGEGPAAGTVPEKLQAFVEKYNDGKLSRSKHPVVLDAIPGGTLVVKNIDGTISFMHGAEARKFILDNHREPKKAQRKGNRLDRAVKRVEVLPHGDDARVAVAQTVLGTPLELDQVEALINAHHWSLNKQAGIVSYTRKLVKHHFTIEQLFGNSDKGSGNSFPGLFKLGLIGNYVPSQQELNKARRDAQQYLRKREEQRKQAVEIRLEMADATKQKS